MTKIDLPYIKRYRDRHGHERFYLRRRGARDIALPGAPGSHDFMAAYHAALAAPAQAVQQQKHGPGTFGALVIEFYRAVEFANLKPKSKATYRFVLEGLAAKHGHRLVRDMPHAKVRKIIEEIGATRPALANLTRAVLRRLLAFAIKLGWRADNPATGVANYRIGSHHTWTEIELSAYEAQWPLGTRERLAYALLLYTGQRGGDVVRMRRQDIVRGAIRITQEKTGREVAVPIHPALDRAMKAAPQSGMHLIGDANGRPIDRPALTRLVRAAATAAGLAAHCKPHGLRKALQRRLAENGATGKELQAIAGHSTLKQTALYTDAADRERLAQRAIRRIRTKG